MEHLAKRDGRSGETSETGKQELVDTRDYGVRNQRSEVRDQKLNYYSMLHAPCLLATYVRCSP